MQWTPELAAEIARRNCPQCRGTGTQGGEHDCSLCDCVLRAIFRSCFQRFRRCGTMHPSLRRVSFERTPNAVDRTVSWVRRNEDYRADFHSAGLRALPRHLYQLFSFYHLHGARMDTLCRRLAMSDRAAWEFVVQIEIVVGREIAFMEPYSLFPPSGYMMPAGRASSASQEKLRLAG